MNDCSEGFEVDVVDDDPRGLNAARGIMNGCLISIPLWTVIVFALLWVL